MIARAPNNSLDRSGGSVFLKMNGAAKVALIRAARSTQTLCASDLLTSMNVPRVLISILVLSLPSVAAGHKLEPCKGSLSRVRNLESQAITKVEASYPNERGVRVKGTVTILIKVNRRGNVVSAHAICGHPLLLASSVAAAIQWKFQPRRVNGRVTNNVGVITFDFTPTESSSVRAAKSL